MLHCFREEEERVFETRARTRERERKKERERKREKLHVSIFVCCLSSFPNAFGPNSSSNSNIRIHPIHRASKKKNRIHRPRARRSIPSSPRGDAFECSLSFFLSLSLSLYECSKNEREKQKRSSHLRSGVRSRNRRSRAAVPVSKGNLGIPWSACRRSLSSCCPRLSLFLRRRRLSPPLSLSGQRPPPRNRAALLLLLLLLPP